MTTTPHTTRSNKILLAAFALALSGCGASPFGVNEGRVQFVLSSGDAVAAASSVQGNTAGDGNDDHHRNEFFASANVTFSSILARDMDGVLVNVAMELPTTVDIVSMEEGRAVTLPDGDLEPGTYDQVVVVMTEVEGVTHNGTTITIAPPGGGWTAIIPICPFVVEDGATTVVGLSLSVRRAFSWRENHFRFDPHFECEQDES